MCALWTGCDTNGDLVIKNAQSKCPSSGCLTADCCEARTCGKAFLQQKMACSSDPTKRFYNPLLAVNSDTACTGDCDTCCTDKPTCDSIGSFSCATGTSLRPDKSTYQCVANDADNNQCTVGECCRTNLQCGASNVACDDATEYKLSTGTVCAKSLTCEKSECCKPKPQCATVQANAAGLCAAATQTFVSDVTKLCQGAVCTADDCCVTNPTCGDADRTTLCTNVQQVDIGIHLDLDRACVWCVIYRPSFPLMTLCESWQAGRHWQPSRPGLQ